LSLQKSKKAIEPPRRQDRQEKLFVFPWHTWRLGGDFLSLHPKNLYDHETPSKCPSLRILRVLRDFAVGLSSLA
jgi:hypothetical protein